NRHVLPWTPQVALALPVTVIAGRVAVLTIDDSECARILSTGKNFSPIAHDRMSDIDIRPRLPRQPTPPDRKKIIKNTLNKNLGCETVERIHRRIEPEAASEHRGLDVGDILFRTPQLRQVSSRLKSLRGLPQIPGPTSA